MGKGIGLRQIMVMEARVEPEIRDKIQVREIEILDDEDNVVARIGAKDGVYEASDKSESIEILTIYDSEDSAVVKIGRDEDGGRFSILGSNGAVHIYHNYYGGLLRIIHSDGDDVYKIDISARQNGFGFVNIFRQGGFIEIYKNDHKISFEADVDDISISIRGKNGTIETLKKIFSIGS